ncbi:hypothetical protein HDK77DRAFT_481496 [Phyllosticta capitalensis]|uniref:Uncharacterized protein n=1 Tax=Phyllosticta capitalensis TaxID=121624 RepID=A0ABR1Z4G7_9PEZI
MFGGPPPPPSKAELARQVNEANQTLNFAYATCTLLYLSPLAIDYAMKLFSR